VVGDNKSDVLHDFCAGFVFDCPSDNSDKNCGDHCLQAKELLLCLYACLLASLPALSRLHCPTHENLPSVFRCVC
jgi:hypothetical protein